MSVSWIPIIASRNLFRSKMKIWKYQYNRFFSGPLPFNTSVQNKKKTQFTTSDHIRQFNTEKPYFELKRGVLYWGVCWTEECVELRGVLNWWVCWTEGCVKLKGLLNWGCVYLKCVFNWGVCWIEGFWCWTGVFSVLNLCGLCIKLRMSVWNWRELIFFQSLQIIFSMPDLDFRIGIDEMKSFGYLESERSYLRKWHQSLYCRSKLAQFL